MLALGVDAVLLAVVVSLVSAGGPALWRTLTGELPDWLRVCASVAAGLVPFLYFWLSWWVVGRGLGGLLLGFTLRQHDGRKPRMLRTAVRALLGLLFAPVFLVGMLLILADPRRRALHDVLFGTIVPRATHDPTTHDPIRETHA